ncbi:MAG: RNA-binding protein [Acidobacteria bacterium]|nr:RNA-binding protein [Acidobacteriota bacterium]
MPGKLFVGNLSFNVVEADLTELCASLNIQAASIKIMRDMELGRSRGFGFIELAPEADMDAAIKELNGKELGGRALTVNEARPPRKREFGGGGPRFGNRPGGGGGNRFGGRDSKRKERERPKRKIQELY